MMFMCSFCVFLILLLLYKKAWKLVVKLSPCNHLMINSECRGIFSDTNLVMNCQSQVWAQSEIEWWKFSGQVTYAKVSHPLVHIIYEEFLSIFWEFLSSTIVSKFKFRKTLTAVFCKILKVGLSIVLSYFCTKVDVLGFSHLHKSVAPIYNWPHDKI